MADILCRWLNKELRLSKSVEPGTLAKDFSSGYLIGEILHKYQLQDDFSMFMNNNASISKLNNFTRIESTLKLLGVPFDLTTAQALMQEQEHAATHLIYQLYITLQKKKNAGLTGTAMELMQTAAITRLHRKENEIYSDRLHTLVKRDAELKLPKLAQHYEIQAQQLQDRSVMALLEQQHQKLKLQDEMRIKHIEKLRAARRRQNEIMARVQTFNIPMPKPPPYKSLQNPDKRQKLRREDEAQSVQADIAQFERNLKDGVTTDFSPSSFSGQSLRQGLKRGPGDGAEVPLESSSEYIQRIRQRLKEDATARQHREMRRSKFLDEQFKAIEAQQDAQLSEQLVMRLTRQSQYEQRMAVQLLQIRRQKEVIRENRLFRERQYQQRRDQDFHEALEREAALVRQAKLDDAEEIRKQMEFRQRMADERAQNRYKKHVNVCREVLEQIVDLATKVGEYRLLTENRIPARMMKEWKESLIRGLSLYGPAEGEQSGFEPQARLDPIELEKQEIFNNQDYDEYTNMAGEWAGPEEAGKAKTLPGYHWILGHVVQRLKRIAHPSKPNIPPPSVPYFTLKACVLGKPFSGKTSCLTKIAQDHGIYVLSVARLLQEALNAARRQEELQGPECSEDAQQDAEETQDQSSSLMQPERHEQDGIDKRKLSVQTLLGVAAETVRRNGQVIPDDLLVDIVVAAIKQVPAKSGWILDGFPMNITQAHLLEKALGGSVCPRNQAADCKKRSAWNDLAHEPNAPQPPPPPALALDLALLLDASDECVLNRAINTSAEQGVVEGTVGPAPSDLTQEPPTAAADGADGAADTADTAASSINNNLSNSQMQYSMTAFHDSWPKLEKWFEAEQSILVRLDADVDEAKLYKMVESVVKRTIYRKKGSTRALRSETDISPKSSPKGQKRRHSICSSTIENIPDGTGSPSATRPGSSGCIYVDEPLPPEIPVYLCQYWKTTCHLYVSTVKEVLQNLRSEQRLIIRHLFNIREEYKHYLGRPDLKQEFVSQWQEDFNSIPDDMREDEDTMAELHQRLDDLRERLWEICDQRKEEDTQERAALMGDGWLDTHTAFLIEDHTRLMQMEVVRFRSALYVLRDYYLGMSGQPLPQLPPDFNSLPLLDITVPEDTAQETQESPEEVKEIDPKFGKIPPLTTQQADLQYAEPSSKDESLIQPPEEQRICYIYQEALRVIASLIPPEAKRKAVEVEVEVEVEAEVEVEVKVEEEVREESQETEGRQSRKSKLAKSPKLLKSPKSTNKSTNETANATTHSAKSTKSEEASAPTSLPPEPIPIKNHKELVEAMLKTEYETAVAHEERAVLARVGLLRGCALGAVRSLQSRAQQIYSSMEEQLAARYLADMTSVDKLTEVVRHHIESFSQLKYELVLGGSEFYLNGDLRVVASPPPSVHPPKEDPTGSTMTVVQLESLYTQLSCVAPTGLMLKEDLSHALQDFISLKSLTEPRIIMAQMQLTEVVSLLTLKSELVDWRQFLLSAALPWPIPTLNQLLATLQRFQTADKNNTGYINWEQYLQTDLWFPIEDQPVAEEPSEPLPYNRLASLRQFFFQMFADHSSSPPRLDYVCMLRYLAAHPDPTQGFTRALSLVLGQLLEHPDGSRLLESLSNLEGAMDFTTTELEEEEEKEAVCGQTVEEQGVSIPALLTVICHTGTKMAGSNRFRPGCKSHEEHTEDLVCVFQKLGYKPEDRVPFSILCQDPLVKQLMESATNHQLIDIYVPQAHPSESEIPEATVS